MAETSDPTRVGGTLVGSTSITAPPPSYASLLKNNNLKAPTYPPVTCRAFRKDGKIAISFSKEDIEKGQTYISSKSVVLKFSAERPSLDLIRSNIQKEWNILGNFTL
ncbi:hypothetical protein FRX31_005005, partial [Thalictrum thalictroides]